VARFPIRVAGCLLLFLTHSITSSAQAPPSSPPQTQGPATKIESLLITKGSLVSKDFFPQGKMIGRMGGGSASVEAIIASRVGSNTSATKGLRIEVKEGGRLERSNTSFLDLEEIGDLLRAIDYFISPASQEEPPAGQSTLDMTPHRETTFATKGDFSLTCFGLPAKRNCAIQSGRIGSTSVFIEGSQLAELKMMVEHARTILQPQ